MMIATLWLGPEKGYWPRELLDTQRIANYARSNRIWNDTAAMVEFAFTSSLAAKAVSISMYRIDDIWYLKHRRLHSTGKNRFDVNMWSYHYVSLVTKLQTQTQNGSQHKGIEMSPARVNVETSQSWYVLAIEITKIAPNNLHSHYCLPERVWRRPHLYAEICRAGSAVS